MNDEVIITKELKDEILRQARTNHRYMALSAAYQQHRMKGEWNQARLICQKMKQIEDKVFEEVVRNYKYERKEMTDIISPMSKEDRNAMNIYANGLIMISDIIENMIIDMNSLVKKYHPDMRVISFNDLGKLAKESKKQVAMFDGINKDDYVTNLFGSTADNLYEMVYNKVQSFVNKVNRHAEGIDKKATRNAEVA